MVWKNLSERVRDQKEAERTGKEKAKGFWGELRRIEESSNPSHEEHMGSEKRDKKKSVEQERSVGACCSSRKF